MKSRPVSGHEGYLLLALAAVAQLAAHGPAREFGVVHVDVVLLRVVNDRLDQHWIDILQASALSSSRRRAQGHDDLSHASLNGSVPALRRRGNRQVRYQWAALHHWCGR